MGTKPEQIYLDERPVFSLNKCATGAIFSRKNSMWQMGTGFILRDSKTVISSYHVIKDCDSIIYNSCSQSVPISVVKTYESLDVAILQAQENLTTPLPCNFQTIPKPSDTVLAMGLDVDRHQLALSEGTVLNLSSEEHAGQLIQFLRFRGYGKRGYSGGPLFDLHGNAIGIILRGNEKNNEAGHSEGVAILSDFFEFCGLVDKGD